MIGEKLDPEVDREAIALPKDRFRLALGGLLLVLALGSLDANIVGPALPQIASDLGGLGQLAWVLTIFLLTSTAATPLYGKLSDMYGRRPLLAAAVLLFLAGSASCGLAQTMPQLLMGRALQGLGAGGLMTLTQITMSDLVSPRRRGSYQGLFGAVFTLASVGGAPLGGAITEFWSWRWIFYVNVPIGLGALVLLWTGLPAGRRTTDHRIDLAGVVLVTAATSCLLLALSSGGALQWSSPIVGMLAIAGFAMLVLLIPVEARVKEPLIPIGMVGNRVWLVATMTSAMMTLAVFGALAFMPLFLQLVLGLSPTASGVAMVPMAVGLTLSLLVGGHMITKTGRYKAFALVGVGLATLTLAALALGARAQAGGIVLGALLLPLGAGLGLLMPSLTVALQNAVDPNDLGTATATTGFFRSLAGAFGVAAAGAIVASHVGTAVPVGPGETHRLGQLGLSEIAALPPAERLIAIGHYQTAIVVILIAAGVVAALALLLVTQLPEKELSNEAGSSRKAA